MKLILFLVFMILSTLSYSQVTDTVKATNQKKVLTSRENKNASKKNIKPVNLGQKDTLIREAARETILGMIKKGYFI